MALTRRGSGAADLDASKRHSRPCTSDDNPYSQAHFKTMKKRPEFLIALAPRRVSQNGFELPPGEEAKKNVGCQCIGHDRIVGRRSASWLRMTVLRSLQKGLIPFQNHPCRCYLAVPCVATQAVCNNALHLPSRPPLPKLFSLDPKRASGPAEWAYQAAKPRISQPAVSIYSDRFSPPALVCKASHAI